MTDAGLADFKDCKNLTTLDLSDTKVSDAGLAHGNDIRGSGLTHLSHQPELIDLSLSHPKLTNLSADPAFPGCRQLLPPTPTAQFTSSDCPNWLSIRSPRND